MKVLLCSTSRKFLLALVVIIIITFGYWQSNFHEHFLESTSSKKKLIFIISSGRSGSSLLVEMFNKFDDEFLYLFEPVHAVQSYFNSNVGDYNNRTHMLAEEKSEFLKDIIACKYRPRNDKYLALINHPKDKMTFMQKLYKNYKCPDSKCKVKLVINSKVMNQVCQEYKNHHIVVKELYIRFPYAEPSSLSYLGIYAGNRDFYLLHLVRDPRAVVNSHKKLNWFFGSNESLYISRLCSIRDSVLQQFTKIQNKVSQRIPLLNVRYEDLPHSAQRLSNFLGLEHLERNFNDFLTEKTKTKSNNGAKDPYSTKSRNIKEVLDKWRKQLPYSLVDLIQYHCKYSMEMLGYKVAMNKSEMKNLEIDLVKPSTIF